jgi:hypothetical protein
VQKVTVIPRSAALLLLLAGAALATAVVAGPAVAQTSPCRQVSAEQAGADQYEICDTDPTRVVAPPDGGGNGGGGDGGGPATAPATIPPVSVQDAAKAPAGAGGLPAKDQAASAPVATAAAVADPGGATASPPTGPGLLPETGGPAALPIAVLVVLVGTGIFGLRRVVRGRS